VLWLCVYVCVCTWTPTPSSHARTRAQTIPNRNKPQNNKTHKDLPKIAEHFKMVRTFYAVYYGVEIMPYVAKAGLRAALGISIGIYACHV
jgi:hypothetical protein